MKKILTLEIVHNDTTTRRQFLYTDQPNRDFAKEINVHQTSLRLAKHGFTKVDYIVAHLIKNMRTVGWKIDEAKPETLVFLNAEQFLRSDLPNATY